MSWFQETHFREIHEFVFVAILGLLFLAIDAALAVLQVRVLGLLGLSNLGGLVIAGIEGFSVGTLIAQVVILALWAGLTPGTTLIRTCYALLMIVVGALLLGGFATRFTPAILELRSFWGADRFGWLFLLLVFSAVQLLVFAIRRWTGYFLTPNPPQSFQEAVGRFSLTEVFAIPVLLCAPLIALTAVLDLLNGAYLFAAIAAVVVMGLLYGGFHIWGVLRPHLSMPHIAVLAALGPLFLLPASLFLTGRLVSGTLYGIPVFFILCCTHFEALTIGLPTAGMARLIGYRLYTQTQSRPVEAQI